MLALPRLELCAQAKARLAAQYACQLAAVLHEFHRRQVEERKLHHARDVVAHERRRNRIVQADNPADGHGVAEMGVGHQCALFGDRQPHHRLHLLDGADRDMFFRLAKECKRGGLLGQRQPRLDGKGSFNPSQQFVRRGVRVGFCPVSGSPGDLRIVVLVAIGIQ